MTRIDEFAPTKFNHQLGAVLKPMPSSPALSIVFMGTADLAATVLSRLAAEPSWKILAVVSQPDRPKGRALQLLPTPVKVQAQRFGLTVLQPEKARSPEFLEALGKLAPDLIVVAAYGQLLPQALLDIPRFGCLNVHTSLLPRYRGAAPIQWSIAHGDLETGVTIMRMDAGLDTGPIVRMESTPIRPEDNGQTLHDRLAVLGAELLIRTIPGYVDGSIVPVAQPIEGATYARRIKKEDGRLDWNQPAHVLWNRIRAFTPWPGAYCQIPAEPHPKLLKIHRANVVTISSSALPGTVVAADKSGICVACGEHALLLTEIQLEGGRRQTAGEFLQGHSLNRLL